MARLIVPMFAVVPLKPLRSAAHLIWRLSHTHCTTACDRRLVMRNVKIRDVDAVKAIDICKKCLGAMTAEDE